jgi:hypothetical protein
MPVARGQQTVIAPIFIPKEDPTFNCHSEGATRLRILRLEKTARFLTAFGMTKGKEVTKK